MVNFVLVKLKFPVVQKRECWINVVLSLSDQCSRIFFANDLPTGK